MGPIALFDKSFLESLSVDESVWFDHFFLPNICPVVFMESLADLTKVGTGNRSGEKRVWSLAQKFPEMSASLNVHHSTICIANLLGEQILMTGKICRTGGRRVRRGDNVGVVFEPTREEDALARWQNNKFMEVERLYAQQWRKALDKLDLRSIAEHTRKLGIDGKSCRSLEDAKELAEATVAGTENPFDRMALAFAILPELAPYRERIIERWIASGQKPLSRYSPYTAYCVTVELFFRFALASDHISWQRVSNRLDIAYLFYLPFSMVFISSDKLHRKCAELFMRDDQSFVWGPELKTDLARINSHFLQLPQETIAQGVMSFARVPPVPPSTLVGRIWDRHIPGARERLNRPIPSDESVSQSIIQQVKEFSEANSDGIEPDDCDTPDPDQMVIKRKVQKVKGSWYQVPSDLEPGEDD